MDSSSASMVCQNEESEQREPATVVTRTDRGDPHGDEDGDADAKKDGLRELEEMQSKSRYSHFRAQKEKATAALAYHASVAGTNMGHRNGEPRRCK